ncbi:MAG TPA: hypothetical protein VLX92_26790 [Kofleriaceae bacterium]|nr:hypothetical protein [Kofleriaceae bacterium]
MSAPALAQTPPPEPPPPSEPPPAPPAPPPTAPAEPPAPPPMAPPPAAEPPHEEPAALHAKWEADIYGFVELDSIYDSTQGLNDLEGNSTVARPNTYTGDHGQTTFGARNSRIGINLHAPTYNQMKASAKLEMDFLGNQPGTPQTATGLVSEQAFWQNPGFRVRHMYVKLETPYLDILAGQTWQLFGWQTMAHENSVQIQGVAGQVYSRSPQIRLSKTIKSGDIGVEIAVAASRPPQRASATPDGQAGIKFVDSAIQALHTAGSTGTSIDGLSVGVSVVGRRFAVNNFAATSNKQVTANGYGISLDALVPIIPATKKHKANALTFTGSFVDGAGIADLYQSLNGGVGNPALPNPGMANPAPTYTANVDGGMVQWFADAAAPGGFSLHPIQWTSYIFGLQYYLPPSGKVWLSANYSHMESSNAHNFGATTKIWDHEDWADGNLFVDLTPAVRFGFEFAWTQQQFVDKTDATDYRGQFSAFYLF